MRPLARAGCARWPEATPAPGQRSRTRARSLSSLRSQLAEGVLVALTLTLTLIRTLTLTLTLTLILIILSPCQTRWVTYTDILTGTKLLGACTALNLTPHPEPLP